MNASKQWELVTSAQKLAVLTPFFGGGSSNCCLSLLIEGSVEILLKIGWNFGAENAIC